MWKYFTCTSYFDKMYSSQILQKFGGATFLLENRTTYDSSVGRMWFTVSHSVEVWQFCKKSFCACRIYVGTS